MEIIKLQLDQLSLDDLEILKRLVAEKIEVKNAQIAREKIIREVNVNGYHCSPIKMDLSTENIKRLGLLYYVELRCFDKEDRSDVKISGAHQKQDEWVEELGFEYRPNKKGF